MTQTIRTTEGNNAVWIEADLGNGKTGSARKIVWYTLTLTEYMAETCPADWADMDEDQADALRDELACFKDGTAVRAIDADITMIFPTEEDARDWAMSQNA